MSKMIIECIPNFKEYKDLKIKKEGRVYIDGDFLIMERKIKDNEKDKRH